MAFDLIGGFDPRFISLKGFRVAPTGGLKLETVWRDSLIVAAMIILSAEFLVLASSALDPIASARARWTSGVLGTLDLLVVVFLGFVLYRSQMGEGTPAAQAKG
jgi:hypothetical protein